MRQGRLAQLGEHQLDKLVQGASNHHETERNAAHRANLALLGHLRFRVVCEVVCEICAKPV
jgi:hypothetical protein